MPPMDRSDVPEKTAARSPSGKARKNLGILGLASALFALAGTVAPASAPAQGNDAIAVIVRASSPIRSASLNELRAVYLDRAPSIQGVAIVAINLPTDDLSRQRFDRAVLGLDPDGVSRHWVDARIRGLPPPPHTLATATDMVRAVARLPNSIGYVPASTPLGATRTIATIRNGLVEPR